MKHRLLHLKSCSKGVAAPEYALLLSLIALVSIGSISNLQSEIGGTFQVACNAINFNASSDGGGSFGTCGTGSDTNTDPETSTANQSAGYQTGDDGDNQDDPPLAPLD